MIRGVYQDARAWADAKQVHKMGWLRVGDIINVLETYGEMLRFAKSVGGEDLVPLDTAYGEYWVKEADLGVASDPIPDPIPDPDPDPVGIDAKALGEAFMIVGAYLRSIIRPRQ